MDSTQVRKAKEHLKKHLVPKLIATTVMESINDIRTNQWEAHVPIGPFYKVGDLNKIGAFWQVDSIVADMIQAVIGRYMHHILGAATNFMSLDDMMNLAKWTETIGIDAQVNKIVREQLGSWPESTIDQEAADIIVRRLQPLTNTPL